MSHARTASPFALMRLARVRAVRLSSRLSYFLSVSLWSRGYDVRSRGIESRESVLRPAGVFETTRWLSFFRRIFFGQRSPHAWAIFSFLPIFRDTLSGPFANLCGWQGGRGTRSPDEIGLYRAERGEKIAAGFIAIEYRCIAVRGAPLPLCD